MDPAADADQVASSLASVHASGSLSPPTAKGIDMNLYAILRRDGWTPDQIESADARSNDAAADRTDSLRKIRSYVLDEPNGRVGTVCLYEATGPDVLIEHARAAGIPCDEVVRVTAIDVQRPDPQATLA